MKRLLIVLFISILIAGQAFAGPPVPIQPAGGSFLGGTLTSELITAASTAGGAGFNLPHGTAPSSPANGDVWTTTAGIYIRVNGSTIGPLNRIATDLSITDQAAGDILYFNGTNWIRLAKGANSSIFGVNSAGTLGYYTSILIDNSAAQFKDATDATKLWTISPVNFSTGVDLTFAPYVTADTTFAPVISSSVITFGSMSLGTTGTIGGGIPQTADADGMSAAEMAAAGMYGRIFWATGAGTWNLSGAAAGMNICVYSTTAAAIVINPDDGDTIVLNGTALSAGDSITSASGAGDFICLIAKDANTWYTLGRSGTWTDTN